MDSSFRLQCPRVNWKIENGSTCITLRQCDSPSVRHTFVSTIIGRSLYYSCDYMIGIIIYELGAIELQRTLVWNYSSFISCIKTVTQDSFIQITPERTPDGNSWLQLKLLYWSLFQTIPIVDIGTLHPALFTFGISRYWNGQFVLWKCHPIWHVSVI